MPIKLTTFPAAAATPSPALAAYDDARPDGLTKEILARAASLALTKGLHDAGYLCETHDLLAPALEAAAGAGASVVNAAVKRLLFLDAVLVPPEGDEADVAAALAAAVNDVVNQKPLTVTHLPPHPAAAGHTLFSAAADGAAADDLAGLDLGAPEFALLRQVVTRTFAAVRPQVYANYRALKDSGAPTAKSEAYGYVFGALSTLIERAAERHGGT